MKLNIQDHEVKRKSGYLRPRRATLKYIVVKLLKVLDKEMILKVGRREKKQIMTRITYVSLHQQGEDAMV